MPDSPPPRTSALGSNSSLVKVSIFALQLAAAVATRTLIPAFDLVWDDDVGLVCDIISFRSNEHTEIIGSASNSTLRAFAADLGLRADVLELRGGSIILILFELL